MAMSSDSYFQKISQWPATDRPREKLIQNGEHTLSDSELLAILLRTGTKGQSALDLGRKILHTFKSFGNMSHIPFAQWKRIEGLGPAKITQIKAAIEIGRRLGEPGLKEPPLTVASSKDAADILTPRMRDLKKEIFKILLLNSQNHILGIEEIEQGTVNYANPIIREVFAKAMEHFAASVICVHNHPSGNPAPSRADKEFTRRLYQSGKILQIPVLDHIIIGHNGYYSFLDQNMLEG